MNNIINILLISGLSGGFGGFAFGISTQSVYSLKVPFSNKSIKMGFLGDIFVGIASSIAILFLAVPLLNLRLIDNQNYEDYLKLIPLGIISGFSGIRLLSGMSINLIEKITTIDKRIELVEIREKADSFLRHAEFLRTNKRFDQAFIFYKKALEINPNNELAAVGLAKAFRQKKMWGKAIDALSSLIKLNPQAERAYYNRACYKNLSNQYSKEVVLEDLNKAISLFDYYKSYSKEDEDFKNLYDDLDFKKLVQ